MSEPTEKPSWAITGDFFNCDPNVYVIWCEFDSFLYLYIIYRYLEFEISITYFFVSVNHFMISRNHVIIPTNMAYISSIPPYLILYWYQNFKKHSYVSLVTICWYQEFEKRVCAYLPFEFIISLKFSTYQEFWLTKWYQDDLYKSLILT